VRTTGVQLGRNNVSIHTPYLQNKQNRTAADQRLPSVSEHYSLEQMSMSLRMFTRLELMI
jgi:hypothetical protein